MPIAKVKYSPLLKNCSKPMMTMPNARTLSMVLANKVIFLKKVLLISANLKAKRYFSLRSS